MIKTKYVRIPSEYQEVEYIESSGTQYINTGVLGSGSMKINIDFEMLNGNTLNTWIALLGARDYTSGWNTDYAYFLCFYFKNNGGANADFNLNYYHEAGSYVQTNAISISNKHNIVFDKGKIYIDGIQSSVSQSEVSYSTATHNVPIALFNIMWWNPDGQRLETQDRGQKFRIYSCKFYDNNGVIVRNFVPCYRKSDNTIGMYDTVNNVFYTNSGTGTFIKGSDMSDQKTVKQIMIKVNNVMKEVQYIKTKALPSAYQEVEYIASTGYQYIQTGYIPKQNTKIYIKMSPTSSATFGEFPVMFGTQNTQYGNAGTFAVYYNSNRSINARTGLNATNIKNSDYSVTTGNVYEIELSFNKLVINGTTYAENVNTWVNITYPINIFTRSNTPVSGETYTMADKGKSPYRLYMFKCYEDDVLVRNFIPCYRKSDNVVGLYETVNGQFYTNAGTGTFTKGSNTDTSMVKVYDRLTNI